jgi:hypothetical protein
MNAPHTVPAIPLEDLTVLAALGSGSPGFDPSKGYGTSVNSLISRGWMERCDPRKGPFVLTEEGRIAAPLAMEALQRWAASRPLSREEYLRRKYGG